MSKQVTFSDDTKINDGGEKIKKAKKTSTKKSKTYSLTLQNLIDQGWTGGCLKHPGCLWSTPCDCKNCSSFI